MSKISTAQLTVYGAPMLAAGFMGTLLSLYLLKFATDVLQIPPGVMGLLLGLAFVWDALTDPVAGFLSDRTHSRFGRRRVWMLASAVPVGLFCFALWSPPRGLEGGALVAWLGLCLLGFFTASTALAVPHLALGAELTGDYDERSRVFGVRQIIDFGGILLAGGAVSLLELAGDERGLAQQIGGAAGLAATGLILFSALRTREPAEARGRGARSPYTALRDIGRNRAARLLLAVFFLEKLGLALLLTLLPYVTQYLLHQPGRTGIFVAGAVLAALLAYPIWFPLARRFGKRDPWIVSTLLKAVAMGGLLLVGAGDAGLLLVLTVAVGATQGAAMILGPSMKADAIDLDEDRTGERKEGSYFAMWNLVEKGATGMAIAVTGAVLGVAGFEANAEQGRDAELALRGLAGGLPMLLHIAAALLLLRFRFGRKEQESVRRRLETRRGEARGRVAERALEASS